MKTWMRDLEKSFEIAWAHMEVYMIIWNDLTWIPKLQMQWNSDEGKFEFTPTG